MIRMNDCLGEGELARRSLPRPAWCGWSGPRCMETAASGSGSTICRTWDAPDGSFDVVALLEHTKLVCQALTELGEFRRLGERKRQIVFLAALLHDTGKTVRTRLEDG